MKTITRFLALLVAVLMMTAGAALGSIGVELPLDAVPREAQASDDPEGETEDDAGSGKDAGDSKGAALHLQGSGRYEAHFKDLDSDWYVHGTDTSAACIQVTSSGERLTDSNLEVDSSRSLSAKGGSVTFGLATTDVHDVHFGFSTDGTKGGSKRYDFATSVLSPSEITSDPGGSDASGSLLGATDLADGCSGGTIDPNSGDTRDVYTFEGTDGDATVFTLAQSASDTSLRLLLLRPDGSEAGSTGSGGSIATVLDATGAWYLAVETALAAEAATMTAAGIAVPISTGDSDTDYTVGECKPLCYE